ncbi:MAG: flagellar hook-associated protein FlgK, partial [Pseudomonadota bacterium]
LDVIAQNVVNVNTKGYVRKVMNPESRVLAGRGAGVQEGGLTRMVNESLLKDIRKNTSVLGKLQVEQSYYPRIDDLFGEVGKDSSISHTIQEFFEAIEVLATDANKPATQLTLAQSGKDVVDRLQSMTAGLQTLRAETDREIEDTVALINQELANIHDLNVKIVKNAAISTGVADLEDKRDLALNRLAEMIDIQYFSRNDGAVIVYTKAGDMLLDNQPQTMAYSANTNIDPWMTRAGGHFSAITLGTDTADMAETIQSGKLKALIDFRDTILPNMQAEMDNLAASLRDTINQVHNRGTILPAISGSATGTRIFAKQGDIVDDAADATADIYRNGALEAAHGGLAFNNLNATYPYLATITATNAIFTAANYPAGTTFTIDNADTPRNNGTYRVVSRDSNNQITVEKVNPRQTIQLSDSDDVVIATFDTDGNQLFKTTLNTIMQTNYSGTYGPTAGDGRTSADFEAKGSRADWSVNEVSAHIESWLRSQGYTTAECKLNSDGKLAIDLKTTGVSLAFRDQSASADGSTHADATIQFDVDGDGATDETVEGFSNFFGLNDFFVNDGQYSIYDSAIQASTYTTTVSRNLRLLDGTGQIGNEISVPAGSSLEDIATLINRHTRTNESALLTSTDFTTSSDVTISVSDGSSTITSVTIAAGTFSLYEIAGKLSTNGIQASVVQEDSGYRLRLHDSSGDALTVDMTGGTIGSTTLGATLSMQQTERMRAAVVPEGSGYRLRVVHSQNREIYAASDLDGNGASLRTDLGFNKAAVRSASLIDVRADIQTAPENISRGAMQYNSDIGRYYLSEGDNQTALQMATAMTTKNSMSSAGGIYAGKYSFSEYASASISLAARNASHSADALDYQTTLNQSLEFQYTSYSGVNLDEEVASMIDFQQAYTASARVITALQEMLETLTSIIR